MNCQARFPKHCVKQACPLLSSHVTSDVLLKLLTRERCKEPPRSAGASRGKKSKFCENGRKDCYFSAVP